MRKETRQRFNQYLDRQAELNGEDASTVRAGGKFSIDPTIQQKLIEKQGESSAFLKQINITPVPELKGETLGLGVSTTIAGRTDTSGAGRRQTTDPTGLVAQDYECKQTNSDTHVRYAKLDMWAKFPDFQTRLSNAINAQQGRDRIMIGFNGTSAAATTDRVAHPMLQDVNVGWLQQLRNYNAGSHVLASGKAAGHVTISPSGAANSDYHNLDALVFDAVNSILPSWAQDDTGLVAILSRDLLADKYFPLVDEKLAPTEQLAADVILASKRVGGHAAARVPFFPTGSILITRYDNLSIYEQEGARRRTIRDEPDADRVATYESSNDAYVVEDFDYALLIENIQIVA